MRRAVGVAILLALLAVSCGADEATDELVTSARVQEAFARTADAELPLRVGTSLGQVVRAPSLGVDVVVEVDPDRPTSIVELEPDGDLHADIDVGSLLAATLAVDDAPETVVEAFGAAHVEMWTVGDEMIIDTTSYQAIAELMPEADLGMFEPGIGAIDLTRVSATADDFVADLVGSGVTDLDTVGQLLPKAFVDVQPDPDDPSAYTASASYGAVYEALGADIETLSTIASGAASSLGVDPDVLVRHYSRALDEVESEVTIRLREDGTVESFGIVADLSRVLSTLLDPESGLALGPVDELAEVRSVLSDLTWTVDLQTTYELDDTIVVTPPEGDFEDRTDDAIAYAAWLDG